MQHTYAKTFNNVELLHNFEEHVNDKNIGSIIKDKETLEKEDKYINKLSDKLSEKILNSDNNIIERHKKKYIFLNPYQYYNEKPEIILNYIKDIYIKLNIKYSDIYTPKEKTKIVTLATVIRAIKKNDDIPNNLKDPLIEAYNNIANKTQIKYSKEIYNQYFLDPIMEIYINKDDDRSQRESETVEEPTTETSDKKR